MELPLLTLVAERARHGLYKTSVLASGGRPTEREKAQLAELAAQNELLFEVPALLQQPVSGEVIFPNSDGLPDAIIRKYRYLVPQG